LNIKDIFRVDIIAPFQYWCYYNDVSKLDRIRHYSLLIDKLPSGIKAEWNKSAFLLVYKNNVYRSNKNEYFMGSIQFIKNIKKDTS
jgi:hypothetical protein